MYQFIVNPNASGGRGMKAWHRVEKELKRRGEEYEAYLTKRKGDASLRAAELTGRCTQPCEIVAIGGDGTMGEVAEGLTFREDVAVGYIPAGSGNDLARSLKLSKKPVKCLKKILDGGSHRLLDYGVMAYGERSAHHRFVVSAGIGMDAAVCRDIAASRQKQQKSRLCPGKWKYLALGIRQLLLARPVKGYLILDGTKKVEFNHIYFVSAHIHPYEGGGFMFAPEADPDDGKLDVRVVHQDHKLRLLPILIGALLGSRKRYRGSRHYVCKEAEIHLERAMPVHYDGESCPEQKELQFCCIPHKLRMIV